MREVRWQIEEQFCFPPKLGVIKKVKAFSVQPKWQMRTFNQSVQLLGVYHLKASVLFKDGRAEPLGILIEDFDFNDDHAYFEYAFPLKVDLPNGEYRDVSLTIMNEKATISPANNLIVSFEVVCKFNSKKRMEADELVSPTQEANNEEVLTEVTVGKTVHHEIETTTAQANNQTTTDDKISVAKLEDASNSIATVQNVDSTLASEEEEIAKPQATQEKFIPTTSEHSAKTTPSQDQSTLRTHKAPSTPKQEEQQKVAVSTTNYEESNSELDFLANLPEDYSELIVQSNKIRP